MTREQGSVLYLAGEVKLRTNKVCESLRNLIAGSSVITEGHSAERINMLMSSSSLSVTGNCSVFSEENKLKLGDGNSGNYTITEES